MQRRRAVGEVKQRRVRGRRAAAVLVAPASSVLAQGEAAADLPGDTSLSSGDVVVRTLGGGDAKIEVDYINNFKQLQKAFSQKKIDRFIEIDKLSKKSFQTNMEFVQARPPSTSSDASDPRLHAGSAAPPWAPRTARWPRGAAVGTPRLHAGPPRRPEACPLHACLSPRSPRRSPSPTPLGIK